MPWSRASELERAILCPGSAHLERTPDTRDKTAANWGTNVHAWKETGEWWEDTQVTRRRQAALIAADMSRSTLWPGTTGHEVSLALRTSVRTVETFSGHHEARESWKKGWDANWLTGTADYIGDLFGTPWIDDLKTGKEVPEDPWDLWQLRFYAVCVMILNPLATEVLTSITHWPRYPADSAPRRLWSAPIPREEVMGTTLGLLEHGRRNIEASKKSLRVYPGAHCTYCSAAPGCPAMQ